MNEYIVLNDYFNLKKGDLISFTRSADFIEVRVLNRKRHIPFYGNEKGKWSADNPAPKKESEPLPNVHFIWVEEKINPFTAIQFKIPECPKNLSKFAHSLYSLHEWNTKCFNKCIQDFINLKIISQ